MPNFPRRQHATFAVLASAALFGTTGTVLVNAPASANAYSVGVMRLLIGGATLTAIASRAHPQPSTFRHWPTSVVGALGVAVFQLCYFLAVDRTGVAIGTVATIGSGPMFAGMITAVIERRGPPARWLLGTALGIGGVALLGLVGSDANVDLVGIALALAAGLGWAVFATVGKHQIGRGRNSTASMATMFSGGAVLIAPLLLWHHPDWVTSTSGALVALYLGVATVGVAYTLYGYALRHLPTPTVVTLTLLEPITAATLGALVVHEQIRPIGWFGIALVLTGLLVVAGVVARRAGHEYNDERVETRV